MRWLWVSLELTTTWSSSAPAASARSAPRALGTSAEYTTPGRRSMRAITSSLPAIAGIASAFTNAAASMRRRPVALSASISRTRSSTGIGSSFCRPSRGPTSRISTAPISTAPGVLGLTRSGYRRPQRDRSRTRIFTGVGPRSNASRMRRSRYRMYVAGSSWVAKSVNVGGSVAPWVA